MTPLNLFDKLQQIEARYEEMNRELARPEVLSDSARYQKLAKAHAEMRAVVEKYREWKEIENGIAGDRALLEDPEMKELAHDELAQLEQKKTEAEQALKFLLLPKDPNDEKNVIVEIRAGTGGDEAALFA
ncbi:MAG TPA: PCRF domain-containing protein, partial [Candidatus Acidoferrales bacterium]|nr:PCRF domain-containing protein [Candidatus Acidoferrales bacterium]